MALDNDLLDRLVAEIMAQANTDPRHRNDIERYVECGTCQRRGVSTPERRCAMAVGFSRDGSLNVRCTTCNHLVFRISPVTLSMGGEQSFSARVAVALDKALSAARDAAAAGKTGHHVALETAAAAARVLDPGP